MLDWKDPLPFHAAIDRGLELFRAVLPRAYPLAFGVSLIVFLMMQNAFEDHRAELDGLVKAGDLAGLVDRFGMAFAALALLTIALNNALLHLVGAFARGEPGVGLGSLGVALRAYPQLVVASIGYGLLTWFGLMLFIVPGAYAAVAFSFFAQAVLFDHDDGWHALGRSLRLTRGAWARTLALYALLFLATFAGSLAIGVLLNLFGKVIALLGAAALAPYFELLVGAAVGAVISVLWYALLVVWYHDLRLRAGVQPSEASFAA